MLVFLGRCWCPNLRQVEPDAVLVIDNLRPHHATQVRQLLDEAAIGLMYLPQYSAVGSTK
jgi:transposase